MALKESKLHKKRLARQWWFTQKFTDRRSAAALAVMLLYISLLIFLMTSNVILAGDFLVISFYIFILLVYRARSLKYSHSLILFGAQRCSEAENKEDAWERFSIHWWTLRRYLQRKMKAGDLFFLQQIQEDESVISVEQPENLEQLFAAIGFDIHDRLVRGEASVLPSYIERLGTVLSEERYIPAMSEMFAELFSHVPRWYRIVVKRRKPAGLLPFLRENVALIEKIITIVGTLATASVLILTYFLKGG